MNIFRIIGNVFLGMDNESSCMNAQRLSVFIYFSFKIVVTYEIRYGLLSIDTGFNVMIQAFIIRASGNRKR